MRNLILIPVLILALFTNAQPLEHTADSLLTAAFRPNEPGISVLIARKGNIIYKKAFGSANLELNTPMQPDMVFRIGSITKQFTAIGVLQLVEQGKISLNDSIQKYIKEFPSKGAVITIENLLTHTSGIKEYTVIDHPDPYIDRHELTPQIIIDHFKNAPLDFPPGTKYAYSNSGYVLLGYLIEKVTGKSYHEYMRENVLKPAGLIRTSYANEQQIIPGRVAGYTRDPGYYQNAWFQSLTLGYAAGDLLSTTEDLFKWNNALYAYKLVKKETLEKAFTAFKLADGKATGYGYGWFVHTRNGLKWIHHEGQVSGFIALESYFPETDTYLSLMTNVKSGEDTTDFSDKRFTLFDQLIGLTAGEELQKKLVLTDKIMDSYVGVYELTGTKRTITISKQQGYLLATISGQGSKPLVFQSEVKFGLEGVMGVNGEFVKENGKVVKFIVWQDGKYEWIKIK